MQELTLTLDEGVLAKARTASAKTGQSLSEFIAALLVKELGPPLTQKEALERYLAGPLLNLTDEKGNAPSRDELHE